MKFKEFEERGLFINEDGKLFDPDLNIYTGDNNNYLELSDKKIKKIFEQQPITVKDYLKEFEGSD